MCKELALMEVSGDAGGGGGAGTGGGGSGGGGGSDKRDNSERQECSLSFKKLIINRCQSEFEKNPVNEVARASKLKEIEECTDPVSDFDKLFHILVVCVSVICKYC